jgi:hypothetical protein
VPTAIPHFAIVAVATTFLLPSAARANFNIAEILVPWSPRVGIDYTLFIVPFETAA